MGMFTTAVAEDGRRYQFKCGNDGCETFRIGDSVGQKVYPDRAGEGYLLDDVYDGIGDAATDDEVWVVIASGILKAIVPREKNADGSWVQFQDNKLFVEYGCKPPPASAWTPEAWARDADRQLRTAFRNRVDDAECYGRTAQEILDLSTARLMRKKLSEDGFARQIIPPQEV